MGAQSTVSEESKAAGRGAEDQKPHGQHSAGKPGTAVKAAHLERPRLSASSLVATQFGVMSIATTLEWDLK